MRKRLWALSALALFFHLTFTFASEAEGPIAWQNWSDDLFAKAKSEKKFVILDLEAVWCHWCHVMADTTYQDPRVVDLINQKYIPVRVDQDANPDISLRYEEWGWPATVVFSPDGKEIVKRRGYIAPEAMVSLLAAIIKNPTPGPSILPEFEVEPAEQAVLTAGQKKVLEDEHNGLYDTEFGGWGVRYKLIDSNNVEYAILKAQKGDKQEEERARKTLTQALNLLDPEWGGFYQYSDERNWKSPHFEKIMSIQASYMRLYSLAFAIWQDPPYLNAAEKISDYIFSFWISPEGAFYTSQDADIDSELTGYKFYELKNAERRKLEKMPRIDTHVYARENGWMIASLCDLYNVTGKDFYLEKAKTAAQWILSNRALPDGGFRHDMKDRAGPYLGDTLAMGQAFLSLYASTGDRQWLSKSEAAADFIQKTFMDIKGGGFITAQIPADAPETFKKPVKQLDENINLVRWTNLLFYYTGNKTYREMAEHAMRYLAAPAITQNRHFLSGLLLADRELAVEPDHITVVGHKDDPKAKSLYLGALRYPSSYRRIEWWDKREGNLPNPDVQYPELNQSAAFACANKSCSLPVFTPEKIASTVDRLKAKKLR